MARTIDELPKLGIYTDDIQARNRIGGVSGVCVKNIDYEINEKRITLDKRRWLVV